MDFFEVVDTRYSTRMWVVILNKDTKEKMVQEISKLYDELAEKMENDKIRIRVKRFRNHSIFFANAPLVVACVLKKQPQFFEGILEEAGFSKEESAYMRPDSQMLSIGGAIENMCLSAHAIGLGACWMVAPVMAQDGLKKVLGIAPEDWLVTLLPIGKPKPIKARAPKKPLEEIMRVIS
jgi:nitroreductase